MLIPCNTWERVKESLGVIHDKRNPEFRVLHGRNEFMSERITCSQKKRVIHGRAVLFRSYLTVYYTVRANVEIGLQFRVLFFISGKIMSSYPPNLPDKETRAFSLRKEFVFAAR